MPLLLGGNIYITLGNDSLDCGAGRIGRGCRIDYERVSSDVADGITAILILRPLACTGIQRVGREGYITKINIRELVAATFHHGGLAVPSLGGTGNGEQILPDCIQVGLI